MQLDTEQTPATGLMGRPLPPHQDFFPLILLPLLLRLALQPTSSPSEFKQVALFCFSSPSVASLSPIPPSLSSAFFLSLLPPCTSTLCFYLFILFVGFSRQEYLSGLPSSSPVDHILSELSSVTCLSRGRQAGLQHPEPEGNGLLHSQPQRWHLPTNFELAPSC